MLNPRIDTDISAQLSKRREAKDCFNCATARRHCDRTRHRCEKCSMNSELCQGYPRELQWLTGVTSRGKQKGRSLSIQASNQPWESTTPTNHTFTFKPERPYGTRKQASQRLKSRCSPKEGPRTPQFVADGSVREPQVHSPCHGELSTSPTSSPSSYSGLSKTTNLCDTMSFDTLLDELDASFIRDISNDDNSAFSLSVSHDALWQCSPGDFNLSESEPSVTTSAFIASMPDLGPSQLLTLYDTELCALPLTVDFHANPFRCNTDSSPYLIHAVFAISIQHISRMSHIHQENELSQHVTRYKRSATELCTAALEVATRQSRKSVIDSMLVLFALDTLTSSLGPWGMRLTDAYRKIESIGGTEAAACSPRSKAQLSMFVWWDCIIALLSRSGTIFPPSYFDIALSYNDDPSWDIHVLSGVPKTLFQYFMELTELANEKEQISQMKYAKFDTTRACELQATIQDYEVAELSLEDLAGADDDAIHSWHDYRNASNAWKSALLLYIARVLLWDRSSRARLPGVTSIARSILDSIRSCRPTSSLRKQLLFPLFLAGAESTDAYSRNFVKEYCEEWYQISRYTMFLEAFALLQELWAQKDTRNDDLGVWWGEIVNHKRRNGSEILFG